MVKLDRLPVSLDAEKFCLGEALKGRFDLVAGALSADDFGIENHRRIFNRMGEIATRGERVDYVTVAAELERQGQLESVGGLSYLVSLDDGVPAIVNLDSYLRMVQDSAALRRLIVQSSHFAEMCSNGSYTAEEAIQAAGNLSQIAAPRNGHDWSTPTGIIEADGGLQAYFSPMRRNGSIQTGWLRLDALLCGLQPKDLVYLAARPSMGKTAAALQIAISAAKQDRKVAIFSLEMSKRALTDRMLCSLSRVDLQKFRSGFLNSDERIRLMRAASHLDGLEIHIEDSGADTIAAQRAALRKLASKIGKIDLVIVDHAQLMSGSGRSSRNDDLSEVSRGFKLSAGEVGATFLVLSQLSRRCEERPDKRPMLSDLRESGSLEQDADVVCFIFREEVYKRDQEHLRGLAEFHVAKQRQGPTGVVRMTWLQQFTTFEPLAEGLE